MKCVSALPVDGVARKGCVACSEEHRGSVGCKLEPYASARRVQMPYYCGILLVLLLLLLLNDNSMYIYIYIYTCVYVYIYIEREIDR